MKRGYRLGAYVMLLLVGASAQSQDWSSRDLSYLGGKSEFARTRAICARLIKAEPPVAEQPTLQERKLLRNCDSEALYYGIGMPADPAKARKCAIVERTHTSDGPPLSLFDAEGMLMMIYANGRGARRNFDIAIHMACQLDDAPAAMDARISHLLELRQKGWTGSNFGSCDDITSGMSGGICANHAARLGEQDRESRIRQMALRWSKAQRALFDHAYNSFVDYAGTAHEMDCWRGTAQAQCAIDGSEADIERFLKRIETLIRGRMPTRDRPPMGREATFNAATSPTEAREFLSTLDRENRSWYEDNARETIAARQKFERNLVAFARAAFPQITSRQIRQIFSDL